MPICAYCNKEGNITKEHVIPAFIYRFQRATGNSFTGWNEAAEKMVGGEFSVKDVCASCNNGQLNELDSYGKTLLETAGLLVRNYQSPSISLRLDPSLLLRWLLKLSYNSSRSDGAHSHLFRPHIPFMLGGGQTPGRHQVALIASMAGPIALKEKREGYEQLFEAAESSATFNPFLVRISYGSIAGNVCSTLRLVIIGPLVLYIPIFEAGTLPGHAAAEIRRIIKRFPTAKEITPSTKAVLLKAGADTWLDLYRHQIMRTLALDPNPLKK